MANVDGTFYSGQTGRPKSSPESPPDLQGEQPFPVNPPGTNPSHDPLTIATPPNGLSLSGQQLSLALSSASTTGALSSTDWNTFNSKIGGTIDSGQVAFGTGANVIGGDTGFTFNSVTKVLTNPGNIIISADSVVNRGIFFRLADGITPAIARFDSSSFQFRFSGVDQWNITSSGVLEGVGNRTIETLGSSSVLSIQPNSTSSRSLLLTQNLRLYSAVNTAVLFNTVNNGAITFAGGNTTDDGGNFALFGSSGGNYIRFRIGSTEHIRVNSNLVGILTDSPTNTLDVNGTTRIRTINNLGSTPASVLVPSATGVVSLRTLAEFVADAGISNLWTDATTFIYRDSPVVIGRTTLPSNATFAVQSKTALGSDEFFKVLNDGGTSLFYIRQDGIGYFSNPRFSFGTTSGSSDQLRHRATVNNNSLKQFLMEDNLGVESFSVDNIGRGILRGSLTVGSGVTTGGGTFLGSGGVSIKSQNGGVDGLRIVDNSNVTRLRWRAVLGLEILNSSGNRTISLYNNFTLDEGINQIFGTTTGTKIGTATTQKIGFWNATPIVQPTTAITAATFVANTSGISDDTATFDGYTIGQVVAALRAEGLLA